MVQQLSFSKKELSQFKARSFGGSSYKRRRKVARPLQVKALHHVVFKSRKALGSWSFYRHKKIVAHLLRERARNHLVELKDFVNMGNHLHLKLKFHDRKQFQNFLRTFPALLARRITGAHRSNKVGGFWEGLVFTRILTTKFEEWRLRTYFEGNHRERELGRAERDRYLRDMNRFFQRLRQVRSAKIAHELLV
jgi:REP element-mobilizing transposase RayT